MKVLRSFCLPVGEKVILSLANVRAESNSDGNVFEFSERALSIGGMC